MSIPGEVLGGPALRQRPRGCAETRFRRAGATGAPTDSRGASSRPDGHRVHLEEHARQGEGGDAAEGLGREAVAEAGVQGLAEGFQLGEVVVDDERAQPDDVFEAETDRSRSRRAAPAR